jgi:very-short-patch-repair endonuclease
LRKSNLGIKFRRQYAIGAYIVDFCSLDKRLVIELDGGQHQQEREADAVRDKFLAERGYAVLRFWNHEVFENTKNVLEQIHKYITPTQPPPKRRNPNGFVHVRGAFDGSVFTGTGEE